MTKQFLVKSKNDFSKNDFFKHLNPYVCFFFSLTSARHPIPAPSSRHSGVTMSSSHLFGPGNDRATLHEGVPGPADRIPIKDGKTIAAVSVAGDGP
ncbi:hypothetical protein BgiBS90_003053 [Biomphalaria glabrata]|nr:hypothetical protein BgiBS90_003053 [Biomphalaria glabrata]